jgi:hypothetical protein
MADKAFGLMTAETDAGDHDNTNRSESQPASDAGQEKNVFEVGF